MKITLSPNNINSEMLSKIHAEVKCIKDIIDIGEYIFDNVFNKNKKQFNDTVLNDNIEFENDQTRMFMSSVRFYIQETFFVNNGIDSKKLMWEHISQLVEIENNDMKTDLVKKTIFKNWSIRRVKKEIKKMVIKSTERSKTPVPFESNRSAVKKYASKVSKLPINKLKTITSTRPFRNEDLIDINGKTFKLIDVVMYETAYLPENAGKPERLSQILWELYSRPVCSCGKEIKFYSTGYGNSCSMECRAKNNIGKKRISKKLNQVTNLNDCAIQTSEKTVQQTKKNMNTKTNIERTVDEIVEPTIHTTVNENEFILELKVNTDFTIVSKYIGQKFNIRREGDNIYMYSI